MIIRARLIAERAELYCVALFITIREHGEGVDMGKLIDLTGVKFGRLTVIKRDDTKDSKVKWICKCLCGNYKPVYGSYLRSGETESCGCLRKESLIKRSTKHGNAPREGVSPEHSTWHAIKQRCGNPNHKRYKDYGGRGISICDRWNNSFMDFLSDMGEKPSPKHSIERIDVNKNYEPDNCKWATTLEQARNQRVRSDNKTGTKGVHWCSTKQRYKVMITVNGKLKHIGTFKILKEAKEAREKAESKYWN